MVQIPCEIHVFTYVYNLSDMLNLNRHRDVHVSTYHITIVPMNIRLVRD